MQYGVSKKVLLIIAGVIWVAAGVNIFRIGILTWLENVDQLLYQIGQALVIFLLFFILIFRRLYYKYTRRIDARKKDGRYCILSFFDLKGWLIMIFMNCLGITIRTFELLPTSFIAVFYAGLSTALMLAGLLFLRYALWVKR